MRVVIAGATSALGIATAAALTEAGHEVVAVGRSAERLEQVQAAERVAADLADFAAVQQLAEQLGAVDGLVHLVGGWRGGGGLAGQSDEDFDWLETNVLTALRNTTRAFAAAIGASAAGRIAIVSTTGLEKPTAGNASYVALKAAAETWLQAVGHELRETPAEVHITRVKALVTEQERIDSPERKFPGYSDVTDVAAELAGLFA
ncbi:SDR family NAD(P)-dependent oxidoreductase [Agrococcus casei]|uniref:Putative oxidoreductase n=1 Tax=Agrococcus casei LMG 22410 TaxID=1255656 RepID=A0A1R4ES34_9MICO|nr:SDR family oxidoreductase [Agrococcus casei]SJM46376.1 putative oxidoreductase [Agrococcus casei LMG 22410]